MLHILNKPGETKSMKQITVCAVILAAGTSNRMGKPKQLLPLNKKPLIEHSIRKCLALPFQKVIAVIGHHADEIKKSVSISDHRFEWVVNQDYEKGQSSSFHKAIREMKKPSPSFMVFLGDQPFISAETNKRVYELGLEQLNVTRESFVIQPFYNEVPGHPVFFGNSHQEDLSQLKGDIGAKKLIARSNQSIQLDIDDPFLVFDIDTPSDYAKAIEMLQSQQTKEKFIK
jgi:molybdenum cofactor cytidylyltransferase